MRSGRTHCVGFATDGEQGPFTADDALGAAALERRGVPVRSLIWSRPLDPEVDVVLLRSTWDYHLRLPEFLRWVDGLEARGIPLWNLPDTVRRNVDKRYLEVLAQRGVPVVPLRQIPRGSGESLRGVLDAQGWTEAVVKPAVSGGGWRTWRTRGAREDEVRFAEQLAMADCLVQPFVPEVVSAGEWSLIFFDGRFSHAVVKRPAVGDFRVQEQFGGSKTEADASPALIEQAARVLTAAREQTLYARVDGVVRAGQFQLLELELVEPSLFFDVVPAAAERFADAVVGWLGKLAGAPRSSNLR
jgi:glutathione synthase/RimK-type ligase-like ATP-grasp enzyme